MEKKLCGDVRVGGVRSVSVTGGSTYTEVGAGASGVANSSDGCVTRAVVIVFVPALCSEALLSTQMSSVTSERSA